MGKFSGKVVLVTGGGRGIGRGISLAFAQEGATVAINYRRDKEAAEETAREVVAAGGQASIHMASTDVPEQCEAMAKEVIAAHGGIDVLVVNGGVASRGKSVADTDAEELWRLVAVHALGPHQLCRAVLPSMRTRGRGDIVFISSTATSYFAAGSAPYSMGKSAQEALAQVLAKEERPHHIHVNVVAPGLVETDMGVRMGRAMTGNMDLKDLRALDDKSPFGRVCQPSDIADVVLWLCSDAAGYVTGQRIEVDGGVSR
jgi:NAD(P)-dependent dehydrogenase (short-subunit alcohol dehydrogenase family)